jgi:hypothetical protein
MISIPYFPFLVAMSALLCLLGILFNNWLCKIGVSRESKKTIIVFVTIFFVFTKSSFFEDISWWEYGTILAVLTAAAVDFSDIVETMKYGKWWWISNEEKEKRSSSM